MGRVVLLLASGALLAATAGCSLCRHGHSVAYASGACSNEAPLPAVERIPQESAIRELAASVLQSPSPPTLSAPNRGEGRVEGDYRALSPQLCQCLAAKHAPLADGFDSQRLALSSRRGRQRPVVCPNRGLTPSARLSRKAEKQEKQRAFQESMLLYSALEVRDQAAGTALEWYYQLAGAEAKDDLLNDSLELSRKTLKRIEELKNLGLSLPAPIEEYQRQIVELQLQQVQNQLQIEQLNSKLRLAMGYSFTISWRIRPEPGVPLGAEGVPDVEAAVQLGLHQRPQLLLLRSMIANLDRDTLSSARIFLQTLNPLLAMSPPGPSCKLLKIAGKILHIQPGQEKEIERIRAQLNDNLHERELVVEAEIRAAVYEIGARREAIILARQAADSWQERIRGLEEQQAQGLKGALDLASAYMELYKARGEVVKEFLGWKIAVAKLKQAQGILPAECGYSECPQN